MHPADIKASLQKAGKPAVRIAEELGINRSCVTRVIRGQTSRRVATRIAEVVGKPVSEIWPGKYESAKRRRRTAA